MEKIREITELKSPTRYEKFHRIHTFRIDNHFHIIFVYVELALASQKKKNNNEKNFFFLLSSFF